jgi:APA family basic amino acid/polyamine antiporter
MAVALVVGNVVGSGVYLLPASLAPFGPSGLVAWLPVAAGALLLAVVFAALARAFPREGGPYAFTREAFGERAAFVVAWSYWVSVWVGNAALATAGVSYASALLPGLAATPGASAASAVAAVWVFTLVNAFGIRAAGWVQAVTTVLKLLPLAAVAAAGALALPRVGTAALADAPLTPGSVTAAATLALWALVGFEAATVPAEKVEDPARTVPRATIAGTALSAVFCSLACAAVLVLVPAGELAASTAPLADAARRLWGDAAAAAVAGLAAVSAFGALNGWILLQGELPWAMARDGLLPRALARESGRGVPATALFGTSVLASAVLLVNAHRGAAQVFTAMILLSTIANLVVYLACSAALLALARRGRSFGRRPGPVVAAAALGAAFSAWAIAGAGREAVLSGAALLLAGLPLHAWTRRRGRAARGGV